MPHVLVEYSANVATHHDIGALLDVIHEAALSQELAALGGHRTRAMERDHYRIADCDPDRAFVAIAIRIGPGRDAASKLALLAAVLDAAEAHIEGQNGPLTIAWSTEVQEIDADFRVNRNHVTSAIQRSEASA